MVSRDCLRSLHCDVKAKARFINGSPNNVALFWFNYNGEEVKYSTLQPEQYIDIETYVTHPWIFKDPATNERFVVCNQKVVFCKSFFVVKNTSEGLVKRLGRLRFKITPPVRSLRRIALLKVTEMVKKEDINSLELPITVKDDLNELKDLYDNVQ